MSMNIRDRLSVQITINGREFPLDRLNSVQYLHITESVRCYLPVLNLQLIDATKFIAQNNLLVDGAIIQVTIGVQGHKKSYEFRRFNHKALPGADGGTQYHISGVLNVPLYWQASTPKAILGTASEAIKAIGTACDLNFYGVTTSESQLWMPHNTRYCEFARQVSERAWVDDSSCVQLAVSADKTLRLVNVSDFESRKPKEMFSNKGNYAASFPVTDQRILSKSGFFNAVSGYQDTRIQQTFVDVTDKTLTQVKVQKNSRALSMNKALKGEVTQSKVSFAPIDAGNVSQHYEDALYQNRRLSNLFTFGVEFLTPHLSDSDLLDIVLCELTLPEVSGLKDISGNFLLTSKVIYIEGMNFYQKMECYRHGPNATQSGSEV